jgi:hypothetical protein
MRFKTMLSMMPELRLATANGHCYFEEKRNLHRRDEEKRSNHIRKNANLKILKEKTESSKI